jgi:hypothetical protein
MLLSDVLDNMPHLRLSNDHMKSILWMIRELNVPDTPGFYALREMQKRLAVEMDIQLCEHTSVLGTKFIAVTPENLLALVSDISPIRLDYSSPTALGKSACSKISAAVSRDHFLDK